MAKREIQLIFLTCFFIVSLLTGYRQFIAKKTRKENTNPSLIPPRKTSLSCENILTNITEGKWVHWSKFISDEKSDEYRKTAEEERKFDDYLNEFRIKRGIHTKLWRDDLKCGLKNTQTKPKGNSWGKSVGAWCDARSENPCCENEYDGVCSQNCNCSTCIDMRKILHAEFARWVPSDEKCKWKNYTADEACKVVQRYSEIHIVGDSFIRKMGRILISTLRSDPTYGILYKKYDERKKKLCVGPDQLYWTECLLDSGTYKELLVDESPLCNMDLDNFVLHSVYSWKAAPIFLELAKKLAGKPGSVILFGVGGHMNCQTESVIDKVVEPPLEYLASFHASNSSKHTVKWPIIIYMFPDTPGLLKSPYYRPKNGKVPCYKFTNEMIPYLKERGIPYLDYRKVTSGVHSYDGTHHGMGVNLQKVQLLFNYLDAISF